jgi:hypothetical protein
MLGDYIDLSPPGVSDRGQIPVMAVTITAPPVLSPPDHTTPGPWSGHVGGDSSHGRLPPFRRGERVGLASQCGQGAGDLGKAGAHVRRGAGLAAAVGMAGVGAGDGVAEVPLTGRERIQCMLIYWMATHGRCLPMRVHRWSYRRGEMRHPETRPAPTAAIRGAPG